MTILRKYGLSAVVVLTILYLSLSTGESLPKVPMFPNIDKLVHFLMYAGLSAVLTFDLRRSRCSLLLTAAIAVVGAAAYGGLLELIQPYFPPRTCDLLDFIADAAGAGCGFIITDMLCRRMHVYIK